MSYFQKNFFESLVIIRIRIHYPGGQLITTDPLVSDLDPPFSDPEPPVSDPDPAISDPYPQILLGAGAVLQKF
jgi:hypothetical protein